MLQLSLIHIFAKKKLPTPMISRSIGLLSMKALRSRGSVSYTHLDVYKRQAYERAVPSRAKEERAVSTAEGRAAL